MAAGLLLLVARNAAAAVASYAGAHLFTSGVARAVSRGRLSRRAARKLTHVATAPLFMSSWPLFTPHRAAGALAALVPAVFALRFARAERSDPLNAAVSRSGDAAEAAQGPAAYGAAVAALTAVGWRARAWVYVAMAALCFGDGFADVVGSACRGPRWWLPEKLFVKRKTVPGSLAFVAATVVGARGMLEVARWARFLDGDLPAWGALFRIACVCAAVEVFPVEDNATVPVAAVIATKLLA